MAVVVKKPGHELSAETLIEFCKKHLESYKVPTRVEFIEAFPRNPGGKVFKKRVETKILWLSLRTFLSPFWGRNFGVITFTARIGGEA